MSQRHPRHEALEGIKGLANQALRMRLQKRRAPPPAQTKEPEPARKEDELGEEDTRRLIEMYEAKQTEE